MLSQLIRQLGTLVFVLMLSACVSINAPEPDNSYTKTTRAHLYEMQRWHLEGRLGIFAPKDSWSANIDWQHQPNADRIKLSGPLGQGAISITLIDERVAIDRGDGHAQTSSNPEQFINQQLGIFVPLQSLRFWATGLPELGQLFQTTSDGFVQNKWLIAYKEMQKVSGESMPRKMTVSNDKIKLKLIVDQWDLNGRNSN